MARGVTLNQLALDVRAELRRSQEPSVGVEDLASIKRTINHVYQVLYYQKDWAFLRRRFPRVTLNAGQRYYDVPAGLDVERIEKISIKHNDLFYPVTRGISLEDYNSHDPESDERSSPALKWDVQFTGTAQIEFWPLPDGATQYAYFEGVQAATPLVNDTDQCWLDSELIILFAAAELAESVGAKDAETKRNMANEHLRMHGLRSSAGGSTPAQMGLGTGREQALSGRAVVRISS